MAEDNIIMNITIFYTVGHVQMFILPVFLCIQFGSSLQIPVLLFPRNPTDILDLPHSTSAIYCEGPIASLWALRLSYLGQHYEPGYTDETFVDFSVW